MRMLRLIILSLSLMFAANPTQILLAQEPKEPLHIILSKTLGFVFGQKHSLTRIQSEYPALSARAQKAELEFSMSFGTAAKNIENALHNILKDEYPKYITAMKNEISVTLMSQPISYESATQFLDEVDSRARGELPSPILETLLHYQYEDNPAGEFRSGYRRQYRTKGHPKSKGLDLQLEYPKSWSSREGNRPNVIQFFNSNNGRGLESALIMVQDLMKQAPEEWTQEKIMALQTPEGAKDLSLEILSDEGLKEMATSMGMLNVHGINSKRIILDRWPGAILEFTGTQQRLDLTLTVYHRIYFIIYKNYMISLQCQIGKLPDDTEDTLKNKISNLVPLLDLMANSLVIQSQY